MSILSRRSIVASAAALPALAVPAVAAVNPSANDKGAMVRRAEEVVELLSTRYIRADWHDNFNKGRAAKFLQNIQQLDLEAEDVELEEEIHAWLSDHGQSYDWIFAGDPGGMICYVADQRSETLADDGKLEELAAKVEAAWDELGATCAPLDAAEQKLWAWKKLNPSATERERQEFGGACGHTAAEAAQQAVADKIRGFLDAMHAIRARSIRGLIAKARVADKTLREDGEPHSVADERVWCIVEDLLAMAVQS
jgi:hypothetical protein